MDPATESLEDHTNIRITLEYLYHWKHPFHGLKFEYFSVKNNGFGSKSLLVNEKYANAPIIKIVYVS